MAIPSYNEFYPFILKILEDKKAYELSVIRDLIKKEMNLTKEDMSEMLPSNKQTVFANRVNWACVYLFKSGIIDRVKRGIYKITKMGEVFIIQNGYNITHNDLIKYESFREFINIDKKPVKDKLKEEIEEIPDETPDMQIEEAFKVLNKQLSDEILNEIMQMSPIFFEKLVLDLLFEMGYGGKDKQRIIHTRYTQDDGIDGLIKEDELGLDYIYIQAKRWGGVVGQPQIQQFSGALSGKGAKKGIFITTSWYSKKAINYADTHQASRIILIDGEKLSKLMITYGVGLSTSYIYKLQKIDKDYYTED